MPITKSDVEKTARLAKLEFSEDEKEKFTHQLSEIVSYVEKLNELNTENVEPTYHVLGIKNVLREDKVEPWLTQKEAVNPFRKSSAGGCRTTSPAASA